MPLAPRKGKSDRRYDRVVAITRSGSTSEALTALASVDFGTRRSAITGVGDVVVPSFVDNSPLLDFADEQSVVQTRLFVALLILARHAYGYDVDGLDRGTPPRRRCRARERSFARRGIFLRLRMRRRSLLRSW